MEQRSALLTAPAIVETRTEGAPATQKTRERAVAAGSKAHASDAT